MIFFILLDTNVILDFAMKREEHYVVAAKIMEEIADGHLIAHVSASQITDLYYFLEKKFSHNEAVSVIADLIDSIRVIRVDEDTIKAAIQSGMDDFEDAVQTVAAKNVYVDIVVTRDKEGFHNSGLQVYSPEEFLEALRP
jgi:predicted nucleic-acid-binding protein